MTRTSGLVGLPISLIAILLACPVLTVASVRFFTRVSETIREADLYSQDLRTGQVEMVAASFARSGRVFSSGDGKLVAFVNRSQLEILVLGSRDTQRRILVDGVEEIEFLVEVLSQGVVIGVLKAGGEYFGSAIIDKASGELLSIADWGSSEWGYVVSLDGERVYRPIASNQRLAFVELNSRSGQPIDTIGFDPGCTPAFLPHFHGGISGKAVISFMESTSLGSQSYVVFDLQTKRASPAISVSYRSIGTLSSTTTHLIVQELAWDSTHVPVEWHTGLIDIFLCRDGSRTTRLNAEASSELVVVSSIPDTVFLSNPDSRTSVPIPLSLSITTPICTFLHPAMTLTAVGPFELSVSGRGFREGAVVLWNGLPRQTTFVADTLLRALVESRDTETEARIPVTVRNPGAVPSAPVEFAVVSSLPAPVKPVLECVVKEDAHAYTAWFGYKNENSVPVYIPVGTRNRFTPLPQDRGQPSVFDPGRRSRIYSVSFDGSDLVWTLNRRTSTASRSSARCR